MTPTCTEVNLLREQVHAAIDVERSTFQAPQAATTNDRPISESDLWRAVRSNEDGDAWVSVQLYRDKLLFDHAAGRWYEWQGHFWAEDLVGESMSALDAVIHLYSIEVRNWAWKRLQATKSGDSEAKDKAKDREAVYLKRISILQSLHRKRNVLILAATGKRSLGISGEEWDAKPWLLACLNGTIDLQSGKLRPGRQEDFLKMVCPTPWRDLDTKSPAWSSFLEDTFQNDRELIAYLQKLLGYSIAGLSTENVFPILWGSGRNGKGSLLQAIAHVLGPLAGPVKSEMLLEQGHTRSSAAPDPDVMALRGKRLVWASETDEGRKLNAGKLKWLCGGDILCGRVPYGRREVQFQPTHTLFLLTNHRPQADPSDYALWQRIHLIPFTLSFVDEPCQVNERKRDPYLAERLRAEASGILAWLVRGCLAWQREGLLPPCKVRAATKEYRQNEDMIGYFIGERCLISASASIRAGELYKAYQAWCEEMGDKPVSGTKFGKLMKERFQWAEARHVVYSGVGLKSDD